MSRAKRFLRSALNPPPAIIGVLAIISACLLWQVFENGRQENWYAYIAYFLSAYTLITFCVRLPGLYQKSRKQIYSNKVCKRYLTDNVLRSRISLYVSLGISLLYSILKLSAGIYYSSVWLGAVAGYYTVLTVSRFFLLQHFRKNQSSLVQEYRRYRFVGYTMTVLSIVLSGMAVQMVLNNQGYRYPGFVIYGAAAYSFYNIIIAIVNIVKYRKLNSPVLSASKAICLAAALVSIYSLQTAMLTKFGGEDGFPTIMNALTGAAVCTMVLGMGIFMVIKANKEISILNIS